MGWESSDTVRFDLGPLLQDQMRTAKHKSAYSLLIIGPRNLLMWSDLTFNPSFKVKQGQPNLKMLITRLLLVTTNYTE